MSGDIVDVWGRRRFNAYEYDCPDWLEEKTLKLRSSENDLFEVSGEAACISGFIVSGAELRMNMTEEETLGEGDDEGGGFSREYIDVPIKSQTMKKVIEFFEHHLEYTATEGQLSNMRNADDMQGLGFSKWDSDFVNLKQVDLFDLLFAANLLQIQSLTLLTQAKAALLVKDKEPSKIRKDFGLTNDLDEDEEEELQDRYTNVMRGKLLGADRVANLAGEAAVLQGAVSAAARNGALAWCKGEDPSEPSVDLKSYKLSCWRVLVLADWRELQSAPADVASDRELQFAAIEQSSGASLEHAPDEIREDGMLILKAVAKAPFALLYASQSLRGDRAFILKAMEADGKALEYASEELRRDKQLVKTAIMLGSGSALQGAADSLRKDEDFVLECVAEAADAFRGADKSLQKSKAFAMKAVEVNGFTLQYMSSSLRADVEIVAKATQSNPEAGIFAHSSRRVDLDMKCPWDSDPIHKHQVKIDDMFEVGQHWKPKSFYDDVDRHVEGVALSKEDRDNKFPGQNMKECQKFIQFSAMNTMQANMGQSNYIASNSFLDKLTFYDRPEKEAITLMWGPVGGIGMRAKAFASADMLNSVPENLMSVYDAQRILNLTCVGMDPPEWYNPCFFDQFSRENCLKITLSNPGYRHELHEGVSTQSPYPKLPLVKPSKEKRPKSGLDAPLGGWLQLGGFAEDAMTSPSLQLQEGAIVRLKGLNNKMNGLLGTAGWLQLGGFAEDAMTSPSLQLQEGAIVRLKGLNNKMNGLLGTAVAQFEGKWKVELEDKAGKALLADRFLEVVAPRGHFDAAVTEQALPKNADMGEHAQKALAGATKESKVATAARRRQEMEEHRAKLKAKSRGCKQQDAVGAEGVEVLSA